jgi:hypothetical protein
MNILVPKSERIRSDRFRIGFALDTVVIEFSFSFSEPSTTSPRKTNNNPGRDAGYERVDLPSDKPLNRPYENVTPENLKETNDTAQPKQRYENVNPMVSSANDKAKAPIGQYEDVFLDSPKEENGEKKKRNDKYYENVDLKN